MLVSLYPASEAPADALEAVLARTAGFYGVYACETDAEKQLALAARLTGLKCHAVLFCGATGDPEEDAGADGLLSALFRMGTDRACGLYGADCYAPAALMGTAMGLVRASGETPFALCYRRIPGTEPTDMTETELARLKALNANVYITRGLSRRLLENGTVASGLRFDEVLSLDRIALELREAALALLTENPGRLPQTDETSAVFINRFSAILNAWSARNVLATAPWRGGAVGSIQPGDIIENGYLLWADSYDRQSDEDRAAHKAVPVHAALCFAGSVECLVIQLDVTV